MGKINGQQTLTETAAETLIGDIVSGVLDPGVPLRLERLSKSYGLGISPIREALIGLASQGFVIAESRRGFRVAAMSKQDLADITALRQMIEKEALQKSIEEGGDDWEIGVVTAMARLKLAVNRRHENTRAMVKDVERAHKQLHRSLIAACDSPRLLQYQETLYNQAERYRHIMLRKIDSLQQFLKVHERLVATVLSRDVAAAQRALGDHLTLTIRDVYKAGTSLKQARISGSK
jgi:GntR family carbon starvation induced transcriptional regulator